MIPWKQIAKWERWLFDWIGRALITQKPIINKEFLTKSKNIPIFELVSQLDQKRVELRIKMQKENPALYFIPSSVFR